MEAGAFRFVTKAFGDAVLLNAIQDATDEAAPHRAAIHVIAALLAEKSHLSRPNRIDASFASHIPALTRREDAGSEAARRLATGE
jgi:FixJ family two-component response regulator